MTVLTTVKIRSLKTAYEEGKRPRAQVSLQVYLQNETCIWGPGRREQKSSSNVSERCDLRMSSWGLRERFIAGQSVCFPKMIRHQLFYSQKNNTRFTSSDATRKWSEDSMYYLKRSKDQTEEVKQKRAQGGCLGTGSRRRTWQAAKSHG